MNKVKTRTMAVLLIGAVLIVALFIFLIRWEEDGESWAIYPFNSHVFHDGIFVSGEVRDREGETLLSTEEGRRVYHQDPLIRCATFHVVGDAEGRVGGSAQSLFQGELAGYSLANGLYSVTGKGRCLSLTIDRELNAAAYQALDGRKGCVALYDYSNGQLLALVSSPGFDPADPPEEEKEGQYLNRFLSGLYPPGSTFKLATLAAAYERLPDLEERRFTCQGSYSLGEGEITCPHAHGDMDIRGALAASCNCVFAALGAELGPETLHSYASQLGLLSSLGVSGYTTAQGSFVPAEAGSLDLGWSAMGQYQDLVCPAAMLRLMGAIANEGRGLTPRLAKKVTNTWGLPTRLPEPTQTETLLRPATAAFIKELMLNNVTAEYGAENFPQLSLGAKSGTAEVGAGEAPHAWFVGFLADGAHPYAFVVVVENGGAGAEIAGPIANRLLQAAIE